MSEYKISFIIVHPVSGDSIHTVTTHQDDDQQAIFHAGFKAREMTSERETVRLLSATRYRQPETVYFKANPDATKLAVNSLYGKGSEHE